MLCTYNKSVIMVSILAVKTTMATMMMMMMMMEHETSVLKSYRDPHATHE